MNVIDVGRDVVRVQESFSTDAAGIFALSLVRDHVAVNSGLCVCAEATDAANFILLIRVTQRVLDERTFAGECFATGNLNNEDINFKHV